jgi:hypothetical protein
VEGRCVSPVRVTAAALGVALAACSLALAHDVREWSRAVDRGDARYRAEPATARWRAEPWLSPGLSRDALELSDDLALRRAEQAFAVAVVARRGLDNGAERARLRSVAELALSDVVASGSDAQAARAGNLLGILAATSDAQADAAASERQAADRFQAAIRADPTNTDAKYNLELLLRRVRVVGTREGPGSGSGTRGASRRGAGSGRPGSGY